jgi:hypothetical protein
MKQSTLVRCVLVAFLFVCVAFSQQPSAPGGRGGGRGGVAPALFTALDSDKDGSLTSAEMKSGFDSWFTKWDSEKSGALTRDQLLAGLSLLFPAPAAPAGAMGVFNLTGNSTPLTAKQTDIDAMLAALPTTAGAKPLRSRKVLVMAHTGAGGFVHSSIPLAAKTVEALGNQGKLWSTTVSYDAADITTANLKQYDSIFLDSTTACFLVGLALLLGGQIYRRAVVSVNVVRGIRQDRKSSPTVLRDGARQQNEQHDSVPFLKRAHST